MEKLKQIINQLRNGIRVEQVVAIRKNECIDESQKNLKSNLRQVDLKGRKKTIGINRAGAVRFGGIVSASNDFIEEDRKVGIENGIGDIINILTGNLDEIYCQLFERLKTVDATRLDIESVSLIVRAIVNDYFGEKGDGVKRLAELMIEDDGTSDLSALKGKDLAACVERAILSQNLFKMAGIESAIKQSTILRNGNRECHAYNIIRSGGKNYIYDTSLPAIDENGNKNPIVGTISDEEYMLIIDGLANHGCQTKQMSNGIIYDSSFGTIEQELRRYSQEELRMFTTNAGLSTTGIQDICERIIDEDDER